MSVTANVKLGKDETVSLDGTTLLGVREVDFELTSKTHDITSWTDSRSSTLTILEDVSIRVLVYWRSDYDRIYQKWNKHPPQAMQINFGAGSSYWVVPESIKGGQPIDGVVSWEVTFRSHIY